MIHRSVGLILMLAILCGCGGLVPTLPPVQYTVRPAGSISFGPSSGLPGGTPLNDQPISLQASCVLPSELDLIDFIRRTAGDTIAGFVDLSRVEFTQLDVRASQGTFNSLTRVTLSLASDKVIPLANLTLGQIASEDGLGYAFVLLADSPVDLLPFLTEIEGDCASLVIQVTGRVPREDVVFNTEISLTVHGTVVL